MGFRLYRAHSDVSRQGFVLKGDRVSLLCYMYVTARSDADLLCPCLYLRPRFSCLVAP